MPGLDGLEPWLRPYAEALLAQARAPLTITSVRRSRSKQRRLYRRYRRGQSRFPAAPPGRSKHERGLAWDMVGPRRELARLGRIWQRWGGRWGGRRDPIHFEV